MSADLETVAGVRQTIAAILPVRLDQAPNWQEGPFPFELGLRRTDSATRATYFTPASAKTLYGTPGRPCRWHRRVSISQEGLCLHGLELLRAATARNPNKALAVLHFTVERPLLPILRSMSHRPAAEPNPLDGVFALGELFHGVAIPPDEASTFTQARPYTIAFLTPGPQHLEVLRTEPESMLPPTADRWLWQLASGSTPSDYPVPAESSDHHLSHAVRISADWSALVLRQGTAFLGHRADSGEGDFFDHGALHASTIYLDALLLGSLQRDHIDELTNDLSDVFDSPRLAHQVASLEQGIARFRSTYWRQHLTAHGPANDLLLAFQDQHRLPVRFDEILAEAADYSRLVQTQESQQISGALGVLTILGLPLGTALGILQVLGDDSLTHLLIALGLSLAAAAAALTTRYGRLVLSSLRGGHGPRQP